MTPGVLQRSVSDLTQVDLQLLSLGNQQCSHGHDSQTAYILLLQL